MKYRLILLAVVFILFGFAKGTLAEDIWIDTSPEALLKAEESTAIQMLKEDYSSERSYIGVDAVIHFSANGVDYELYHVVDTYSGCFTLSMIGDPLYHPYSLFGGEADPEAEAYFEAEDAAKDAYFESWGQVP